MTVTLHHHLEVATEDQRYKIVANDIVDGPATVTHLKHGYWAPTAPQEALAVLEKIAPYMELIEGSGRAVNHTQSVY